MREIQVNIRFTEREFEMLEDISTRWGIPRAEVIRELIKNEHAEIRRN